MSTRTGPFVGPNGPAKQKYIPMHNKMVVVQVLEDASGSTTAAGLVMPDTVGWKTPRYIVIATGLRCEVVQPGDVVLIDLTISPQNLKTFRYDGDEVLHVHEDLLGGVIPHDGIAEREKLRATFPKN